MAGRSARTMTRRSFQALTPHLLGRRIPGWRYQRFTGNHGRKSVNELSPAILSELRHAAQLSALIGAAPISAVFPACVQYAYLNNNTNYTSFWAQGVDADIGYTMDTDFGAFKVEDNFTINTKFDEGFAYHAAPQPNLIASTINTEGENSTFPNIALQMRGHLGWADEGFVSDLFINYTGAYRNIATPVNPVVLQFPRGL